MKLTELLASLKEAKVSGDTKIEISGLTQNSRQVRPGFLFVAIRGTQADGHLYINDAIQAGATAVVCEETEFPVHNAAKIVVRDSRVALARLADAFYDHPSSKLRLVGVTGTNGKTTVTYLIRHILTRAGIDSGLIGTIEYRVDGRTIPADRTTPDPVFIHSLMAEMVAHHSGAAVMEVSSHAIDQQRVEALDFDVAVFTNLTQDHLDYHHDLDSYLEVKARLFAMLEPGPEGTPPKRAIVNADDPHAARIIAASRAPVTTFGIDTQADVRGIDVQLGRTGCSFTAVTPHGTFPVRLDLLGRHNVLNALAAIGVAQALGLDTETIVAGLADAVSVPGRLEFIDNDRGFVVVVDYAHTDDALRNVLVSLREITPGRLLTVFGCGGDRDPGKRPKMGAAVRELADFSIITSDNPRTEKPDAIIAAILPAYNGTDAYEVHVDRRIAIERAIELAEPGDTVLIAGKGHETYQQFRNHTIVFDDREVVREILAGQTEGH